MPAQLTSLDEAWSDWASGRAEPALRRCLAILGADAAQDTAAALLTAVLAGEGDEHAEAYASRLLDVFIDRGDLPRAVALAKVAGGGLDRVARAFGKGGARSADVTVAPPPLPPSGLRPVTVAASALRGLAHRALDAALARHLEPSPVTTVPDLPLFGQLGAPALQRLLEAFELRTVASGVHVIEEGAPGAEAFVVVRGRLRAYRAPRDSSAEDTVLAELGPGAIFGEMALVSGAPRAASVVAIEPAQLLVASVEELDRVAKSAPAVGRELSAFCRTRMISNLIRHSEILGAVAPCQRPALMQRFEPRTFERGERLVEREAQTDGLFLIASGQVRVVGLDADGDELVVAELGPGDVVGEIGLVLRRPATAHVVATHHTVALELTRAHFQEAIDEYPELLGELYDLATKRDDELRTVVAQETLDVADVVLL